MEKLSSEFAFVVDEKVRHVSTGQHQQQLLPVSCNGSVSFPRTKIPGDMEHKNSDENENWELLGNDIDSYEYETRTENQFMGTSLSSTVAVQQPGIVTLSSTPFENGMIMISERDENHNHLDQDDKSDTIVLVENESGTTTYSDGTTDVGSSTLRRHRVNSISTPDLRSYVTSIVPDDSSIDDDYVDCNVTVNTSATSSVPGDATINNHSSSVLVDNDSYSFVSLSPGSVVAATSVTTTTTTNTSAALSCASNLLRKLSFKDVLLLAKNATNTSSESSSDSVSSSQQCEEEIKKPTTSNTIKKKIMFSDTRFVVETNSNKMKRSAQSAVDLRSLSVLHEKECQSSNRYNNDDDDDYDHGGFPGSSSSSSSSCGVEFYYHHKAMGSKGHSNGLKIRPDEAKRRDMIIQKKNVQRNATTSSNIRNKVATVGGSKKK